MLLEILAWVGLAALAVGVVLGFTKYQKAASILGGSGALALLVRDFLDPEGAWWVRICLMFVVALEVLMLYLSFNKGIAESQE